MPPFITNISLGTWTWFLQDFEWLSLLNMHPVHSLLLPTGYVNLCVNMLGLTDHTLLCGSLRRMLFLLACKEQKKRKEKEKTPVVVMTQPAWLREGVT